MANSENKMIEILLVEDNPGDVQLTKEAFLEGKIRNNMTVMRDGVEAFNHLKNPNVTRPDIILLDLNLPRMGGLELLEKIKDDLELRVIPVVILTTSQDEADIAKSYRSHANCYIAKPVDFENFMQVVRSLEDFWLTVVRLPSHS